MFVSPLVDTSLTKWSHVAGVLPGIFNNEEFSLSATQQLHDMILECKVRKHVDYDYAINYGKVSSKSSTCR